MLTPKQQEHFDVFGFLCLRQAFSAAEMAEITEAADELWREDRGGQPDDGRHQGLAPFVERSPRLLDLAEDDRIFGVASDLLGPGFLWSGSEGHKDGPTDGEHNWHADRPGAAETEYRRLKVMVYLAPTTRDQGALRVIPGSHRMPFHEWLWPLQANHFKDGTVGDSFGARGEEMPCCPLETMPGDVVFFHHSLFHAAYGKFPERRYIAFKFVTRPDTEAKLRSMQHYAARAFDVDPALLARPRLRPIAEDLIELGQQAAALAG